MKKMRVALDGIHTRDVMPVGWTYTVEVRRPCPAKWRNFRLCFATTPDASVVRVAGWVVYHDGAWWVRRHSCLARVIAHEADYSWVRARTRAGCVRFLARATLRDLKHDPMMNGIKVPAWTAYVKARAELALKLGDRIFDTPRQATPVRKYRLRGQSK